MNYVGYAMFGVILLYIMVGAKMQKLSWPVLVLLCLGTVLIFCIYNFTYQSLLKNRESVLCDFLEAETRRSSKEGVRFTSGKYGAWIEIILENVKDPEAPGIELVPPERISRVSQVGAVKHHFLAQNEYQDHFNRKSLRMLNEQ